MVNIVFTVLETSLCLFLVTFLAISDFASGYVHGPLGFVPGIDRCKDHPCKNGGKCIPMEELYEGYRCNCTNNYRGLNCTNGPGELNGYCDINSTCIGQNVVCEQNVCQCIEGYYGTPFKSVCREITVLKVSGVNATLITGEMSANVSWNLPLDPDNVHQYEIRFSYSGGKEKYKVVRRTSWTIISDLLAGTTYSIYVASIEYNGLKPQSVASETTVITTKTVCTTREIRNEIQEFQNLINCTVIEGNLKILLIDHATSEEFAQLRFPDLVEISDYLLMYRVYSLKTLRNMFPNLAVIRGNELFFNFALVVFEMVDLEELGLISLTVIERGAVRLEKNPNLCYVTTIDWSLIAVKVKEEDNFIKENKEPAECVNICPEICPSTKVKGKPQMVKRCWTAEDCQTRLISCSSCAGKPGRYCYRHRGVDHCCHSSCLGGCYGERSSDCVACKNVTVTGGFEGKPTCRPSCVPGTFMYKKRRCLLDKECIKMKMMIIESEQGSKAGICVKDCPAGYMEDTTHPHKCVPCKKDCPKECHAARVDSINEAQKLKGCTIITGPLEIRIMKGSNIGEELEENLGQIREIQGHVWIHSSHALLSLYFFKSLQKIHGENLHNGFSLLVNDNVNLQKLFPEEVENRLQILNGSMFFHFNRKLCLNKIKEFESKVHMLLPKSQNDISNTTNGDQMPCLVTQLNLTIISVSATVAFMNWENFKIPDARNLLSYVIYYKIAPFQNVSIYDGRDACSDDVWNTKDVLNKIGKKKGELFSTLLVGLEPWTQYAIYVQTYTTASARYGAMSKLIYFRTAPDMPTSPANLVVTAVRSNELLVTWDPPTKPQGNVTHYEVYWRKRDIAAVQYSKRNYCIDPLKRLDLENEQSVTVKPDPKAKNDSDDGKKCCACPRTEEEKASEQLEREIQIRFENYLQNIIYTKRADRKFVEPGKTRALNLPRNTTKQKGSRRRRRKRNAFPAEIDPHEKAKYKPNPDGTESVNETSVNETKKAETPYFKAVVMTKELILSNLGHFEDYSVEVIACQERDPRDPRKVKLCSNRAITMGRTLPNKEADSLDPRTIKTHQNTTRPGDVLITWEEPPNPNGLIITYYIEYSNVNTPDHEKPKLCIPHKNYTKDRGAMLTNLSPANYTFRIQASSLAGKGEWTPYKFFYIPMKPDQVWREETLIAVTVSVVLLILLLTIIVVWFCARRKFNKIPDIVLNTSANPEYMSYQDAYEADDWEVDRDKIKLLKELGQGSFGMVYKGFLTEDDQKMETPVAVKTVNDKATFSERTSFLKEASIMKGFRCHHVVKLLGVVSKGQPALVIMELMSNGDLKNFLRLHRPDEEDNDGRLPPTLKRIIQMSGEIADGMAYLADKKFVHRDLAARNCMVSDDLTVKIGDFGMTRDIYETDYYRKGGKGLLPVRWMGPESLKDGIFTSMSDIWSYGVVLWEMATLAAQPYQGLSNEEVLKYVLSGKIMERPDGCPQRLFDLMLMCWQYRPKNRPTFKEIIELLVPELEPEFREKSYFFSDENKQDYNLDDLERQDFCMDDVDLDFDDINQDDSQMPFINMGNSGRGLSEGSLQSHELQEESDFVDADFVTNNYPPHSKFSTEPCDCVMLQETNNSDNHNHRNSSCSFNNSAIGSSSDGSKDSSKSSTGSYAHMNGINQHVANGHIPLHMRMTSC